MKMVYTNENRFIVANARNILQSHRIDLLVKNEFAAGIIGEISAFDSWVELWVKNDADYERAIEILATAFSEQEAHEWQCGYCEEENDSSFDTCWKCQNDRESGPSVMA